MPMPLHYAYRLRETARAEAAPEVPPHPALVVGVIALVVIFYLGLIAMTLVLGW